MKLRLVSIFLGVLGATALLPEFAGAQMPFTSTAPPSPFNRSTGLPPSTPVPRANPVQGTMPGGAMAPAGYPQAGGYPSAAASFGGPVDPDHRLGRGDQLSYRVVEDRDDKVYPLFVTDSGEVELPLGSLRVKATGKTTQQLAGDIKSTLEREYYYHATVQLGLNLVAQGASKGKVYFNGEIASKGALDLPVEGQLTLSQAILQLGGFTEEANQKKVRIVRKGGPKDGIIVDVKAILKGETDKDVILQPGDQITVPKTFWNIKA